MKCTIYGCLVGLFAMLAIVMPLSAHHSFTAVFDIDKPVAVSGTISKVDWINPHVQIYVDVMDETGKPVTWQWEGWGTGNNHRAGFNKDLLAIGTPIKISGYRAKDGTKTLAYLRHVSLPGREFELWVGGIQGTPDQQR